MCILAHRRVREHVKAGKNNLKKKPNTKTYIYIHVRTVSLLYNYCNVYLIIIIQVNSNNKTATRLNKIDRFSWSSWEFFFLIHFSALDVIGIKLPYIFSSHLFFTFLSDHKLTLTLNASGGFYSLGPPSPHQQLFVLSVVLDNPENLPQVVKIGNTSKLC